MSTRIVTHSSEINKSTQISSVICQSLSKMYVDDMKDREKNTAMMEYLTLIISESKSD